MMYHNTVIWPQAYYLDHVCFITDSDNTKSFGFLDPAHVIQAVHLIPALAHGETDELLGCSIVYGSTLQEGLLDS